jgi:hypothetical protein
LVFIDPCLVFAGMRPGKGDIPYGLAIFKEEWCVNIKEFVSARMLRGGGRNTWIKTYSGGSSKCEADARPREKPPGWIEGAA